MKQEKTKSYKYKRQKKKWLKGSTLSFVWLAENAAASPLTPTIIPERAHCFLAVISQSGSKDHANILVDCTV